jgi:hypothetical protein
MNSVDLRLRIFLSWSGQDSHDLASALRSWLHDVNHLFAPWMSSQDITKGQRWNSELIDALRITNQGIICVTPDNIDSRWLHFEAGALLGIGPTDTTRVRPVLLGLSSDQLTGPLATFQSTDATDPDDMLKLAQSINDFCPEPLPPDRLKRAFVRCWDDYHGEVTAVLDRNRPPAPTRSTHDLVKEILDVVRGLERTGGPAVRVAARSSSMPRLSSSDDA